MKWSLLSIGKLLHFILIAYVNKEFIQHGSNEDFFQYPTVFYLMPHSH